MLLDEAQRGVCVCVRAALVGRYGPEDERNRNETKEGSKEREGKEGKRKERRGSGREGRARDLVPSLGVASDLPL